MNLLWRKPHRKMKSKFWIKLWMSWLSQSPQSCLIARHWPECHQVSLGEGHWWSFWCPSWSPVVATLCRSPKVARCLRRRLLGHQRSLTQCSCTSWKRGGYCRWCRQRPEAQSSFAGLLDSGICWQFHCAPLQLDWKWLWKQQQALRFSWFLLSLLCPRFVTCSSSSGTSSALWERGSWLDTVYTCCIGAGGRMRSKPRISSLMVRAASSSSPPGRTRVHAQPSEEQAASGGGSLSRYHWGQVGSDLYEAATVSEPWQQHVGARPFVAGPCQW